MIFVNAPPERAVYRGAQSPALVTDMTLPGKQESYWIATARGPSYPALNTDTDTDVAIIGGGLVGIATAILLGAAERRVVLIEAHRIVERVTGRTTAKVTVLHGLIYHYLIEHFGQNQAQQYLDANMAGLRQIAAWIEDYHIECDFERTPACTFSMTSDGLEAIHREVAAMRQLGLPADYVDRDALTVPFAGGIRLDQQAQFHPRRFLLPLAQRVIDSGGRIFENTRVLDVDGDGPCRVVTRNGIITARDVVVATHLPILDRGGHFARAFPVSHVALAARIDERQLPRGLYLSTGEASWSLRTVRDPEGPLLLAIGPGFRTGHDDVLERYGQLAEFIETHFSVRRIEYHWINQDYYSSDRIPYVGRVTPESEHIYTATGFGGWGITNGVAAATIIADALLGRDNPSAALFNAHRFTNAGKVLRENTHVAKTWLHDHLHKPPENDPEGLAPGAAMVTTSGGDTIGAWRDPDGVLHKVSAVCTHMGCTLRWNDYADTWDCPCHGSRFTPDGDILSGPAVHPLKRK